MYAISSDGNQYFTGFTTLEDALQTAYMKNHWARFWVADISQHKDSIIIETPTEYEIRGTPIPVDFTTKEAEKENTDAEATNEQEEQEEQEELVKALEILENTDAEATNEQEDPTKCPRCKRSTNDLKIQQQKRFDNILNAIHRYNNINKPIPPEWLKELTELLDILNIT